MDPPIVVKGMVVLVLGLEVASGPEIAETPESKK